MGEAVSDPLWNENSDSILGALFAVRVSLWCNSDGVLTYLVAGLGFTFLGSANLFTVCLPAFLASKKSVLLFYSESALGG